MKISQRLKRSASFRSVNFLFVDSRANLFEDSIILKSISILDNYKLSITCLALSIICFWYKLIFASIGLGWVNSYKLWAFFILLAFVFCEKKRILSSRSILYLIIFLGSILLSSLWASINGLNLEMLLTGFLSLTPFVLAFVIASTYKSKIIFINILMALSLPLFIAGLIQWLQGVNTTSLWISASENLVKTRIFGLLENPNALGGVAMMASIIGLFAFLDKRRWYYAIYSALSILVLILTFSRSAWLGLAVSLIVIVLIKNWRLIIIAPLLLLGLLSSTIRQRVYVIFSPDYLTDASLDGRIWSISNMIRFFKTSPILGVGPGTYGTQNSITYNSPIYLGGLQNGYSPFGPADSQWFQILSQLGLFGVLSLGLFFVSHFVNNFRNYLTSKSYLSLGIMASIIALIMNGFFENVLSFGVIAILAGSYMGLGVRYD